ncbi:S1C family serine protease [Aporhodopirellula aestuarii]|uniref:PDZ domain-containing protein n=1 Tax=Aporhodopirellula aestuarii TaxID=2950107 RepID=A0ABT0UAX4_9BACT|nr:PDZ domain-containing protein [Aporhodopirellula aestuarii]MCM2373675.1 PDZ domain-containing protein [Aporhodopirellula aestuarii]
MKTFTRLTLTLLATCMITSLGFAKDVDQTTAPAEPETQATLGIAVSPLPEALASHLPDVLSQDRGVLVSSVIEGSAADNAGIQRHDIVVRYNDQDIYSTEQLVKQVRNDQPGATVELEYIHAGKLHSATVTLGEETKRARLYKNDWPGLNSRLNTPWFSMRPSFKVDSQFNLDDSTQWQEFETLSVTKDVDGKYTVRIVYKDANGDSVGHEFTGTQNEVRDAIEADKNLPEDRKDQLLRTLDNGNGRSIGGFQFDVPQWNGFRRELFNWPNVDF